MSEVAEHCGVALHALASQKFSSNPSARIKIHVVNYTLIWRRHYGAACLFSRVYKEKFAEPHKT